MIRPKLQDYKAPQKLSEYPEATCYEAGHLVTKNAGWRNKKPVIQHDKCVGCLQCYLYCPDGVIRKASQTIAQAVKAEEAGKNKKTGIEKVAIDYDFCKGCGICSKICKLKAITMEVESNE